MTNVLTLGEKMVLAARLAAVEHVRLELAAAADREAMATDSVKADADEAATLTKPVPVLLGEVFRRIESHTRMPRVRGAA